MNTQHWRFILVQDPKNLATLARDGTTGPWVKDADFAVIINIDPKVPASTIDAGRVLQDMQLAAWNFGIVSRLFTGIKDADLRRDFNIPPEVKPMAVLGFGYPVREIRGRSRGSRSKSSSTQSGSESASIRQSSSQNGRMHQPFDSPLEDNLLRGP